MKQEILVKKKDIIKASGMIVAAALGLSLLFNITSFSLKPIVYTFFLLLFFGGLVADLIFRNKLQTILRDRYPVWADESDKMAKRKRTTPQLFLSPAQEDRLLEYMNEDKESEIIKKEYKQYDIVSLIWRGLTAIVFFIIIIIL